MDILNEHLAKADQWIPGMREFEGLIITLGIVLVTFAGLSLVSLALSDDVAWKLLVVGSLGFWFLPLVGSTSIYRPVSVSRRVPTSATTILNSR